MNVVAENAATRERILSLVTELTDAQMTIPFEGGWTIGAELAHLAFWERVLVGRLRAALEAGRDLPGPFPAGAVDALNNAGLNGRRLIESGAAIRLFTDASSEADVYLASLDPLVVDRIRSGSIAADGHHNRFERPVHRAIGAESGVRR